MEVRGHPLSQDQEGVPERVFSIICTATSNLCCAVKKEFVKLSGINPSRFKAILVSTQVVAGKNYFFKVETGDNSYIHIKAFVPLHQRKAEPSLLAFQLNREREEDLEYF